MQTKMSGVNCYQILAGVSFLLPISSLDKQRRIDKIKIDDK
jgi:hypothetical protein